MARVLIVSLGSTPGLRASDAELAGSLERAGADVAIATASPPRPVRTLALTDLAWARASRAAAREALARGPRPDAVVYSTITAALLAPTPGAIRLDALGATNRPGRHGIWQRPRERAVLRRAPLLIPVSEEALAGAPAGHGPVLVVPIAVAASGPPEPVRDIAAITYAADAHKKNLERVVAAWAAARREGEELVVAGDVRLEAGEGVRAVGALPRAEYRALVRRARVYVSAPRREEYGIAQLEALADGTMLVAAWPGPGYAALSISRTLDPRLVGEDLASAIRVALDDPLPGYGAAASPLLERFSPASVDRLVAERLLPALAGDA